MKQELRIQNYEVSVHLGCSPEEQKYLQPVRFSLVVLFENETKGAVSDRLGDALDYVKVTDLMREEAKKKNYHLIEHLGHSVFIVLVNHLKSIGFKGELQLEAQKVNVPVENLKNGVVFSCSQKL